MVHQRRRLHDRMYETPHVADGVSWLITNGTLECINNAENSDCSDNWPLWQQASLVMLQLRMEIRAAQPSRDDIEKVFLDSATTAWSALADVYCKDKPSGFFTDLEEKLRACPIAH